MVLMLDFVLMLLIKQKTLYNQRKRLSNHYNKMRMTQDNIHFKGFWQSLTDAQKLEYREYSINQQKDWYINYLENRTNF